MHGGCGRLGALNVNQNEFCSAIVRDAVSRVIILRQWEQPIDEIEPLWQVWVFVPDEEDQDLLMGNRLAGADAETLCFERLDDAYRYVRACGYRLGIRVEDQIVEADEADDI